MFELEVVNSEFEKFSVMDLLIILSNWRYFDEVFECEL